jgi:undecaprenyl-diphosphatase
VIVLLVLAIVTATGALGAYALVRRWPALDPASPRAAAHAPARAVEARPRLARLVSERLDPATATGLALSIAVVVITAGAVAFGVLVYMVRRESGLESYDVSIAQWAARNATDASTTIMKVITELGGTRVLVPLTIVVGVIAWRHHRHGAVIGFLVLAVVGQNLLSNGIKLLVDRVRPDVDPLAGFSGPSFPSGHTTAAAACFAAFALVLGRRRPLSVKAWLAAGAVGVGVAVGGTRVLLGVHWFTDVLGGLALGWAWFAVCSVAFGGRLLRFGAPVEVVTRSPEVVEPASDIRPV